MLNQKQQYNHSEFKKCLNVADFAKIHEFKDTSGKILGRNKIFNILRELKILDKNNVPYQGYVKYFKSLDKEYESGDKVFKKILIFITPDGQIYLANKINDYLGKKSEVKHQYVVGGVDLSGEKEQYCSSPLDFNREEALKYLQELPAILYNSGFAVELRKKWQFAPEELGNG